MNENLWLWVVGSVLTLFGFFATRWINRIDEDRKHHAAQQQDDKAKHEARLLQLERHTMQKTEVQGWLGRLDRDRAKLENRINAVEKDTVTKSDAIALYQELKNDLRYQIQEMRHNNRYH